MTFNQFSSAVSALAFLIIPLYFGIACIGAHHPFGAAVSFTVWGWTLRYYFDTLHA